MNIPLNPELENYVRSQVSAGMFRDESEVVARALSKMMDENRDTDPKGWRKYVGAWKDKDIDGLEHQLKLRAEWDD